MMYLEILELWTSLIKMNSESHFLKSLMIYNIASMFSSRKNPITCVSLHDIMNIIGINLYFVIPLIFFLDEGFNLTNILQMNVSILYTVGYPWFLRRVNFDEK